MPTIADEMDRRSFFYSLQMPLMSQFVRGLDKGKAMYFHFVKSEYRTPGGLLARPVLTSYYKSKHFVERPFDPFAVYTSPNEAVLCTDSDQSMYAQLLCGLVQSSEVVRVGSVFASGFIRAIRNLEAHWARFCRDIRTGTVDPAVTDKAVRAAVERVLGRPNPALADRIEAECRKESWEGIIPRIWPNAKYIEVIVTGTMSQYIPTLDYYSNGLPLACTMYGSSECYFGLNLNPMCKPSEVAYTLIPTMAYFEFLPTNCTDPHKEDLVPLTDVKLGHEYELVVTTYSGEDGSNLFVSLHNYMYVPAVVCIYIYIYRTERSHCVRAGLYRYRVGDLLRVAGFKNKAPQFSFVRRKNVALSIDSDKTDEVELHKAVSSAVNHLEPFGASLAEYTSYADTGTTPGHYVLYWELREGGKAVPPSVFEDCCLAVEESLNSVYRQGRASDKSIGPLEIRIVCGRAFDKLMDYALSQGASINQYKAPRCLKSEAMIELMNQMVLSTFFSPKCPKWVCCHKQWIKEN